jgi:hypothetical protein
VGAPDGRSAGVPAAVSSTRGGVGPRAVGESVLDLRRRPAWSRRAIQDGVVAGGELLDRRWRSRGWWRSCRSKPLRALAPSDGLPATISRRPADGGEDVARPGEHLAVAAVARAVLRYGCIFPRP